eukprot:TRINITY_DN1227_c0_g1_i1.p1 TRINITY_DN1227_c0_g1~~TRINITY_DN1227_c0_g1_i1.p1  ORF type:complete len:159 (+),score=37.34 TRINITY_DN1227_c0_g1_i1:96-572(+)
MSRTYVALSNVEKDLYDLENPQDSLAEVTDQGFYHCVQCDNQLYDSDDKITGAAATPRFSAALPNSVKVAESFSYGLPRQICTCEKCGLYLGHCQAVTGQTGLTHYILSSSLMFKEDDDVEVAQEEEVGEAALWKKLGLVAAVGAIAGFAIFRLYSKN